MPLHTEIRTQLLARQAELAARVEAAEAALDTPGDPDVEEQASNRQTDEVIEGLEAAALDELKQIRAALSRMAAGTFGHCIDCGATIPQGRLQAVPHSAKCKDCA